MRSGALKHIRTIFAILLLLFYALLFLDFREVVDEKLFAPILYIQFVPSFVKFIIAGIVTATGFIVVLVLTLLTGRTYCSFLCPLGVFQDVISRAGGLIKKRFRRYGYKKPWSILRYFILIMTAVIMVPGGVYVLTILDPFSIFGRIMTFFIKPVLLLLNNMGASLLGRIDVFTLYNVDIKSFEVVAYLVPAAFLLLIGFLSLSYGRLYCNTVCPVGTLLGLAGKVSLFRIRFHDEKCTRCGRCAAVCKSSCIDFLNKKVDLSRCVACFNCIDACKDDGMSYGIVKYEKKRKEEKPSDNSRRGFIAGTIALLAGGSHLLRAQDSRSETARESTVKEDRLYPVSPPGSSGIAMFTSRCIACTLCIEVCPTGVLQPSVSEYGIAGIMQPRMDYHSGFCIYDCIRCTEVCPTGAIMPLMVEAKRLTQIGKAVFIRENCIVESDKTACGACSAHCPTKACKMIPFENGLMIPEIMDDICIGCGACEYACPTTPYKAIFVDGNPLHEAALNPETDGSVPVISEFPF